jgi:putative FmdB family regulatory protein
MPLYDYHCEDCGKTVEKFFMMSKYPQSIKCECGKRARKVCVAMGYQDQWGRAGGLIDDHPAWMAHTLENLQKEGERPIESRSEMKRVMSVRGVRFRDEVDPVRKTKDKPRYSPEFRAKAIEAIAEAGFNDRRLTVNI